jgi:hypothetical protein
MPNTSVDVGVGVLVKVLVRVNVAVDVGNSSICGTPRVGVGSRVAVDVGVFVGVFVGGGKPPQTLAYTCVVRSSPALTKLRIPTCNWLTSAAVQPASVHGFVVHVCATALYDPDAGSAVPAMPKTVADCHTRNEGEMVCVPDTERLST